MTTDTTAQTPPESPRTQEPLLCVEDLRTWFHLREATARAVDGVSFSVRPGTTLGVVGESGCGKSVTALSILRLIPTPPGRIESGRIHFQGQDLLALDEDRMRRIRGNHISMIFQEPMTSLNPIHSVGSQVAEALRLHQDMNRKEAWAEAVRMLERVRISDAARRAKDFPHHLSGGMRQRVMIAMALACDPELLIADEPTTAVDVTVQAQILDLMHELQDETGAAVQLITHDLGVVAETADDIVVMYAGMIVESGPTRTVLDHPAHPYTVGLLKSIPKLGEIREGKTLSTIPGTVPSPSNWPEGCRFHPRCPHVTDACKQAIPELEPFENNHHTRCIRAQDLFA